MEDSVKHGLLDKRGCFQEAIAINESGLYSLILSSKLDAAKRFKRWVTSEVLPAIRKQGRYELESRIWVLESEVKLRIHHRVRSCLK